MEIDVEILDQYGKFQNDTIKFSILSFLKHMAMAGQGFMPTVQNYTRMIGLFFHYIEYLSLDALRESRLSEPPSERQDPTEKGQFSNIVGKAIADLLARRISGARVTLNYEGAMVANGNKIKGRRPDLYCIGQEYQFAVEAKGYEVGVISSSSMNKHKDQSRQGPLQVNFTVASVSYNLYHAMKAKYYDPHNDNVYFNIKLNQTLLNIYYRGLFEYLRKDRLPVEVGEVGERECFFIRIIGPNTPYPIVIDEHFVLCLVLQSSLQSLTIPEAHNEFPIFPETQIENERAFLDTDGVGLALLSLDNTSTTKLRRHFYLDS